jgi:hypothetical protein
MFPLPCPHCRSLPSSPLQRLSRRGLLVLQGFGGMLKQGIKVGGQDFWRYLNLKPARINPRLNIGIRGKRPCGRCREPSIQFVSVHLQRDGFIGAFIQEAADILGRELHQSQLLVLNDMNEFMEQEPLRERRVGDHRVHECDRRHEGEVWHSTQLESHSLEFAVEGRVADPLPGEDYNSRRVQRGRRKERLHCRPLVRV